MLLRAVELPPRGLLTWPMALAFAAGGVIVSMAWLAGMMWVGRRLHLVLPSPITMLLAAFAISYLLLPLVHHLFFTPSAYRYITSSTNYFAFAPACSSSVASWPSRWRSPRTEFIGYIKLHSAAESKSVVIQHLSTVFDPNGGAL